MQQKIYVVLWSKGGDEIQVLWQSVRMILLLLLLLLLK